MSETKPIVYIVQHNHFDPIWRRCWDRTFDYRGKRYHSYAEIEERVIDRWIENAKQGAVFSEGQSVVIRKYLERNPDKLETLRRLVSDGKLELTAAGETVADTNMPSGETLLRNLVMGQLYFHDTFGVTPSLGWLEDAFGQSAQMPQLLRGVECNHVTRLCYKQVPGPYWKGLDGSVIFKGGVRGGSAGHYIKTPPCEHCEGVGCDHCDHTGFDYDRVTITRESLEAVMAKEFATDTISLVTVGGEEAYPRPDFVEIVGKAAEEHGLDLRLGGFGVVSDYFKDEISKSDDPDLETSDQVEGNPASTGCYVSRIKIKQEFRRIENLLNIAERWATVAYLQGADYPAECLTQAWRSLLFVAFHDAITSTHIDSAYFELLDMLAEAEHESHHVIEHAMEALEPRIGGEQGKMYLALFNCESWAHDDVVTVTLSGTRGRPRLVDEIGRQVPVLDARAEGEEVLITFRSPVVPALGYTALEITADAAPLDAGEITDGPGALENEFVRISVADRGIASIFDKRLNRECFDTRTYFGNELILEEDIGHPWGTMQPPGFEERLSEYTTSVQIRKAAGMSQVRITGQYRGDDPNVKVLSWRQWVSIYEGIDRIDFRTVIDWDTAQRRIRVAFPTQIKTDTAMYAIPYGALERSSYELDMTILPSTNGDWPAINWVDVHDPAQGWGAALINTGTPSHKVIDGVIYMSLLRSPTDSWCLNEPEYYDCPDFDGARDAGTHEFRYSLLLHAGDYRQGNIEKRAREVNSPLMVRFVEEPEGDLGLVHSFGDLRLSDTVIVSAIKKAEADDSVIVRLAETAGTQGSAEVSLEGAGTKKHLVNYLERQPEPLDGPAELAPFKVVTLKLST